MPARMYSFALAALNRSHTASYRFFTLSYRHVFSHIDSSRTKGRKNILRSDRCLRGNPGTVKRRLAQSRCRSEDGGMEKRG